jgi:hypothetical protein
MSKKYSRRVLPSADADLEGLEQYIEEQCSAPLTAARQFQLLYQLLDWLEEYAELPAVNVELSIQYGKIMRNIRFGKKMTIVYSVEDNVVYIHRIMPQSMIICEE